LTSDRALKIIRGLQGINLVGMDLVEVAPSYDHAEITSLAGATLALEMLYVLGANKGA
jgi:agmatinase